MAFKLGAIGQVVEGVEELQQRLRILLFTQKRAIPGDPEFGTAIADFIPDPVGNRARIIAELACVCQRHRQSASEDHSPQHLDRPLPA